MTQKKHFSIASLLFTIAALISAYLVYEHYQLINGEDFKSVCNLNAVVNCDLVNTSKYSTFLALPLASWGLAYYILAAILSLISARSVYNIRETGFLLLPLALVSVLGSAVLAVISVSLIKAICLFCMTLYALNLATTFLIYFACRDHVFPLGSEFEKADRTRLAFFGGLGLVILGATAGVSLEMHHPLPFDVAAFADTYRSTPPINVELGESPRLGNASENPPIRLVEFSDFECPFCAKQSKELVRILHSYGDSVQLVFKNYPLDMACNSKMKNPMHRYSCLAARAALCSHEQNKFSEYHEKLFSSQKELSPENLRRWATEKGMDLNAFEQCLNDDRSAAALRKDIALGQTLDLSGTPTFFINGRKFQGLVTEQTIQYLLDHPEGR